MARAKGSVRLALVVDLAKRKREQADQILLESRQRLDQAKQGLEQLQGFLQEYLESSRLTKGARISVIDLQIPASFITRLRTNIAQQQSVITEYTQQHAQVEEWWRKLYAREKAILKLQQKLSDREALVEEKSLQKQIDELWQNRPINPM